MPGLKLVTFCWCCVQVVEEGIRAGNIAAVLQKCVNDLLDLTDLVRGKLGVQVCSLVTIDSCIFQWVADLDL